MISHNSVSDSAGLAVFMQVWYRVTHVDAVTGGLGLAESINLDAVVLLHVANLSFLTAW